jgi:isocitrate lyase
MRNSTEAGARWHGVTRPYSPADVERVRGSLRVEHTLARRGAEKLWQLLQNED